MLAVDARYGAAGGAAGEVVAGGGAVDEFEALFESEQQWEQ